MPRFATSFSPPPQTTLSCNKSYCTTDTFAAQTLDRQVSAPEKVVAKEYPSRLSSQNHFQAQLPRLTTPSNARDEED